jgi:hypothetical protein
MSTSKYTIIRRIYLGRCIRRALLCCTDPELRWIVTGCEEYLAIKGIRKDERVELEDWRRIVLEEIQNRQLLGMIRSPGL